MTCVPMLVKSYKYTKTRPLTLTYSLKIDFIDNFVICIAVGTYIHIY